MVAHGTGCGVSGQGNKLRVAYGSSTVSARFDFDPQKSKRAPICFNMYTALSYAPVAAPSGDYEIALQQLFQVHPQV